MLRPLLLAIVALSLPAAAGVAVSPLIIDKPITAADNQLEFVVSNSTGEAMRIELSTAPLGHDRAGAPVELNGYRYDASSQIRLPQQSFVLAPQRWKRVRATVELPQRTGGGYALIYVKALPAKLDPAATIVTALRIAVLAELTFPGSPSAKVTLGDLVPDKQGLKVAVNNPGTVHAKPAGRVVLRTLDGKERWQAPFSGGNVFPELTREFRVEGVPHGVAEGQYLAEVELHAPVEAKLERRVALVEGQFVLSSPSRVAKRR